MNKIIFIIITAIFSTFSLTGCGQTNGGSPNENKVNKDKTGIDNISSRNGTQNQYGKPNTTTKVS